MKKIMLIWIFIFSACNFDNIQAAETVCSNEESLQRVLLEASSGDVIRLQPGTYRVTEPIYIARDITLSGMTGNPKDVLLESSGEGCLILNADAAKICAMTIRVRTSEETRAKERSNASAVKIRRGKSMLLKCLVTTDRNWGIEIEGEQAEPHIESCEIYDCANDGFRFMDKAKGTIVNCEIRGNGYDGIFLTDGANPIFRDCKVCNNLGVGIHPKGDEAKGTFERCEIFGNDLSGICTCSGEMDIVIRDCRIYNNKAAGIASASGRIDNCHIYDNAKSGVSLYDNLVLQGCHIENNGEYGISVNSNGGVFQKNTLSGNTKGNWFLNGEIDNIKRIDNSPNE